MSYDQWKTASPYDDYDDEHCAYCGADLPDDVTGFSVENESAVMDGFCNRACAESGASGDISPRYGLPQITEEQQKRIDALWTHLSNWRMQTPPAQVTLADIGEYFPDGDFKWDEDDPGDTHVYCCGEKDCDQQWHEEWYTTKIERKDGKLTIEAHDSDDICAGWKEGEDFIASGISYYFGESHLNSYFVGWLEYWLDAAVTGKDPCNQVMTRPQKPSEWVNFCIKASQDNANCLKLEAR